MAKLQTKLQTLKTRAEFQRVRGGGRATSAAFVVEGKPRQAATGSSAGPNAVKQVAASPIEGPRFGFTITKKIGNAVTRNRIRRRLRAALLELAPSADPLTDYVIVARTHAAKQDYASLSADLKRALAKVQTSAPRSKAR